MTDHAERLRALAEQEDAWAEREEEILEVFRDALADAPRNSGDSAALSLRISYAVADRERARAMARHYRQQAEEIGR